MLIPFGILSAAAGVEDAGPAYELIESAILTSNESSVTFSNLGTYASTYKHLQIRAVVRSSRTGDTGSALNIRINGDTGSNYATHTLRGNGSNVISTASTSTNVPQILDSIPATNAAGNAFAGGVIDFLDAYSTTKNKTIRNLGGIHGAGSPANTFVFLNSVLYNSTSSITSIEFYDAVAANLVAGSRFSIYGIKG
jgi:hypothetical protein